MEAAGALLSWPHCVFNHRNATRTRQAKGQGPPEGCLIVFSLSPESQRCSLWGHSARAGLQSRPSQTHSSRLCCARTPMTHFLSRTREDSVIQQHRCRLPAWHCAGSCPSRRGCRELCSRLEGPDTQAPRGVGASTSGLCCRQPMRPCT